jgi:hypothetical protein
MAYIIPTDSENLLLTIEQGLIRVSRSLKSMYDLSTIGKGDRVFLLDFEKNSLYGPFYSSCSGASEEKNPKDGPFNGFGRVRSHYLYDSIRVDCSEVGKRGIPFDSPDPKKIPFLLERAQDEEIAHRLLIMNTERLPLILSFTRSDGSLKATVVGIEGETFVRNYTCSLSETLVPLISRKMHVGEDLCSRGRQKAFISILREIGELVYSNILEPLDLDLLFSSGGYSVYIAGKDVREIPFELAFRDSFIFEKNSIIFTSERVHALPRRAKNIEVQSVLVIADPSLQYRFAYQEGILLYELFEHEGITADLIARPLEQDLAAGLFSRYGLVHFAGHTETQGSSPGWDMGRFCFHASDLPSQTRFPSFIFSSSCSNTIKLGVELLECGAKSVLCSRWQVPDSDMSEFVLSFYKLLLGGVETGEAFNWTVNRSYEKELFTPLLFSLHGHSRMRYEKQY